MRKKHRPTRAPFDLGAMPSPQIMHTVDAGRVDASPRTVFDVVRDVKRWPEYLSHYRWVRIHQSTTDGGGVVEMSANRPFGIFNWPTWWLSHMQVVEVPYLAVRFVHVRGITRGMEVEWRFDPAESGGTNVILVHSWRGPRWPLIGGLAAAIVIGPVFIHGIAQRTLRGLARVATKADGRKNGYVRLGEPIR